MWECLLYSKYSLGEYLLYSKVSGGKVYYIANIPRGKVCYAEGLLYDTGCTNAGPSSLGNKTVRGQPAALIQAQQIKNYLPACGSTVTV